MNDHRELYNAALEERREAYKRVKVSIRYGDQSVQLKEVRAYDPDQARWSFSSQQATLRRLDKVFQAFFRRVKAGGKPGYPRFKGRGWSDTVEWPKDGDGCRWDSQPEHPTATYVRLQGIGHVRVHQHRPVRGRVKTISVKREGNRWYVVLSCNDVPAKTLPASGAVVGIDMGVASLVTTSDGEHLVNPRHLAASAEQLAAAQRDLARKKRGSKRRRKAVTRVAHKAESAGRELIPVNPANTSRTCARCGHCAKENRPTQAEFACTACRHTAHADVNAAINILRAGLALRDAAEAA